MKNDYEIVSLLRQWMETFFTRSMSSSKRYFKAQSLSMPQFGILMFLHHGGMRGVHDIGHRMDVTSAAASQLIDRLVQNGFVERAENPDDRRERRITLTDKGRELIKQSIEERYRWVEDLVAALSEEEKQAVVELLPVLIQGERRLDGSGERRAEIDPVTNAGK